MTQNEKMILQGRIYPALQSCVHYRYLILAGYMVSWGFFYKNIKAIELLGAEIFTSLWIILWTAIAFHNLKNYYDNAKEGCLLERREFKFGETCDMEIFFFTVFFITLLITAFMLISKFMSCSCSTPAC
jgi:hypothetical protein